jgi:hypothetical protein
LAESVVVFRFGDTKVGQENCLLQAWGQSFFKKSLLEGLANCFSSQLIFAGFTGGGCFTFVVRPAGKTGRAR